MGWTKNANAVISLSLSDFLRADYINIEEICSESIAENPLP